MTDANDKARGGIELPADGTLTAEDYRSLLGGMEARGDSALDLYLRAKAAKMLRGPRGLSVAHWRCDQGCLLLDAFRLPGGALGTYKPAFRLSPERNTETSPVAQSRLTSDGDRRWIESADVILPDDLTYWLNCDHLANYVVTGEHARIAGEARAGKQIVTTR